jgi:hypothetical protein
MKLMLILALMVCAGVTAQAQMFTQGNLPTVGMELTWTQCDTVGVTPGPEGTGRDQRGLEGTRGDWKGPEGTGRDRR